MASLLEADDISPGISGEVMAVFSSPAEVTEVARAGVITWVACGVSLSPADVTGADDIPGEVMAVFSGTAEVARATMVI